MSDVLKKFGRYFLLDLVAQGGMAEIYRARLAAVDGAGRLLVIKRIQAGFDGNSEFQKMFKDEIKVTMGFNHPNIVQLYDFGHEGGLPYIAMEFVDGKNLRQFISRYAESHQAFPIELAAFVIEQAASGLFYAHSFRDKMSGQPLNIVHRDISPQNLLVSYEGTVKVIDFGIAKASTNMESTRAGVIKGKPSYLSPEQITGEVLDGRSDIFSLGAVLWEVLTGKKLFAGENDLAVLKMIESCQTYVKPPSSVNSKVPKELDFITLKALAKQREKRYQTAEELQRALRKFLYGYAPDFNPSDLGYSAKDLFKNDIVDDRKKIQRLNDEVERLLVNTAVESSASAGGKGTGQEEKTVLGSRGPRIELEVKKGETGLEVEKPTSGGAPRGRSSHPNLPPPSGKRPAEVVTAQQLAQIQAGQSGKVVLPTPQAPAQRYEQKAVGGGSRGVIILAVAASLAVAVFGPEFGIRIPIVTDLVESVMGGETELVLQGNEKNVAITLDGKPVATSLPASLKAFPAGQAVRVSVVGASGAFEQLITLNRGEKKSIRVAYAQRDIGSTNSLPVAVPSVTTPPSALGTEALSLVPAGKNSILLRLNLTPGGGRPVITVGGKAVPSESPMIQVPLDTSLTLTAERQGFKSFHSEFVIDSRQVNGLKEYLKDVPMEPLQFGFITIHTTPSADATILLEGKAWVQKTPLEHEKIPVGVYNVKLSNDVLGMEKTIRVSVQEGRIVNIDERLELKK